MPSDSTPAPPEPEVLLWTSKQAARALAISERTLFSLAKRQIVPSLRIGGSVRFDPRLLRRWIEEQGNGAGEDGLAAEDPTGGHVS